MSSLAPSFPSASSIASASSITSVSSVPSAQSAPSVPSVPSAQSAPSVPSVPSASAAPPNDNEGQIWDERTIRLLIDQRKHRNQEYHQIVGKSRRKFWNSISRRINRSAETNFEGIQCKRKFQSLVSNYYVSKINI